MAQKHGKRYRALTEKFDLEQPISDGLGLPDQLVQPLIGNGAVALLGAFIISEFPRARSPRS